MGFFKKLIEKTTGKNGQTGLRGTTGNENAEPNTSGIIAFEYSYIGSIGADSHDYSVKMSGEDCVFSFEGMQYRKYSDLEMKVDPSVFNRLGEIYEKYEVACWDGFNASDSDVLDGDGFSLRINFADGARLRAHGSNAFPKNYREFVNDMRKILDPFRVEVLEKGRQELIKKGLTGEFEGGIFNFIQKGRAGSDSYFAMIFKQDTRKSNCEIRVKTPEYSNLPERELRIFKTVPDEMLHLDEIDALVKKYNLIEWYDYDKAAEDYNNAEWFQIDLGYGDDGISACGTEHPKNYDAFRRDFLKILKKIISEVQGL